MSELSELKYELKDKKEFPIKLSWKQICVVAPILISIIGTSFGLGMKTQNGINQVEFIKKERDLQKQISVIDEKNIELSRYNKELQEDCLYFKNRYQVTADRLKSAEETISNFGEHR